jgi:Kef-type K+ transport system membrane component KefB
MAVVGLAMVSYGLMDMRRLWEAPTWVGFIFVSFILPQAIYIETSGVGSQIESWFAWYYITICLIAFWWGFNFAKRRMPRPAFPRLNRRQDNRLAVRSLVLLVLGAASLFKIRQMTAEAPTHEKKIARRQQ